MPDLDHAVARYGESLGLQNLSLGVQGAARLRLKNGAIFGFEAAEDTLIVTGIFPAPFVRPGQLLDAMRLANSRVNLWPSPPQIGVKGNGSDAQLVIACRVEGASPGVADIARTVEQVQAWFGNWQSQQR